VAQFGNQVRYIRQENQGLAGARNTAIRAANADLMALLDADDKWHPAFLGKMVSLAAQYPSATVLYCSAQAMDEDGRELPQVFGGPPISPETMHQTLLRANFLIPSTTLLRRSVIVEVGLFDQNLRGCEDWDLWLRILPKHTFVGTPDRLVRYRLHGKSLSASRDGMQQAVRAVVKKHFGPDDGQRQAWSGEKRRIYGGMYGYHLLTSVQGQSNWQVAARYLRRAIEADPTLVTDLDLFYELALGAQPAGYRGSSYKLDLPRNATRIRSMLKEVFTSSRPRETSLRRKTYGTAGAALGLVAYNTGQQSLSRSFLMSALCYRPELVRDRLIVGDLIKSCVGRTLVRCLKKWIEPHRSRQLPQIQ
jgi:glycosyltransferase involved in cell wall biosynthesis